MLEETVNENIPRRSLRNGRMEVDTKPFTGSDDDAVPADNVAVVVPSSPPVLAVVELDVAVLVASVVAEALLKETAAVAATVAPEAAAAPAGAGIVGLD